jgi:thiol peroxidase
MAQTKLKDVVVQTAGELPDPNTIAPDFELVDADLKEVTLNSFNGHNIILNIFPSIDTRVCATSVREFNKRAASLPNTKVVCVSKDLPFALKRFCGAEGIENVVVLSDFRNKSFGSDYGVELLNGAFKGLHARAVIVIDADKKVKHTELVPVIGQEPDYEAAIRAVS